MHDVSPPSPQLAQAVQIDQEGDTEMQDNQILSHQDPQKRALNKRLEEIGWGLFLIIIGGIWLLPDEQVPPGVWLIGAGLIMLGINGARYLNGIKMSGFTIILGALALIAGLGGLVGVKLPFFAILFILIGASIILKPLIEKKQR
jgi:hypothetical protein